MPSKASFFLIVTGIALILAGAGILWEPGLLLYRMSSLEGDIPDRQWVMRAFGTGVIAAGLAVCLELGVPGRRIRMAGLAVLAVLLVAMFLLFTQQLADWWVDDAGITFAYSRTLAEGAGVTFQPGEPPTEGYSSTLWMLVLAGAGALGVDIPATAKVLGILFGCATLLLCLRLAWQRTASPSALLLAGAAVSTTPFIVWSTSGQEHAMQGLLLTLVVCAAAWTRHWRTWAALLLSLLVLTRPETPLIVIAVFCTALALSWRGTGRPDVRHNLILALLPLLTFAALMAWRLLYFGDPMPNPYYAKAQGSGFVGFFNPFGGGWKYLLDGLRDTGLIALLALAFLLRPRGRQDPLVILAAVLAGHLLFVIWAKGDWMGQYRFLMPVTALLALPAVFAVEQVASSLVRAALCLLLSLFLMVTTLGEMDRFSVRPTTPLGLISEIGREFAALSRTLGIEDPLLAHHDAGGISYDRSIRLVDLGGLVNRKIARNMRNRDFLEEYIFEQRRPDYIFGAINFAARSGFTEADTFGRDYVPLEFEDRPVMRSDLSHIRRDRVRDAPGLEVERDADGTVKKLIVTQDGARTAGSAGTGSP